MNRPIAFFLSELYGGGAQRVIVNLANEFVKKGLVVHLVLAKAEGDYLPKVNPQVIIIDLKAKKLIWSFFPLINYLKKNQPQWLISALSGANLLALSAKFVTKGQLKTMITIHNNLSLEAKNQIYQRRKLLPYLQRICYSQSDLIVAVSQGVANSLAEVTSISKQRITVIYNPVVTPQIQQMALESVTQDWFTNSKVPVILGVGRLNQQKDFSNLIKAFAIVQQQKPAKLVILGEGEERPQLEALVQQLGLENDVILPGFVTNPYAYMAKAKVFVLSSAWEGFGNVLVEAMACGTPVVSTNCPSGPEEILEGGKYGKLVPIKNSIALADAIIASLTAPSNSDKLRSRANDFSVAKISHQYFNLINIKN